MTNIDSSKNTRETLEVPITAAPIVTIIFEENHNNYIVNLNTQQ